MTLTTERLREIASSPSFSANPLSHEVKYMARELLANREAQPVALVDRRPAASGGICWQHGGKDLPHGTELFTAPPAPAVPEEISTRQAIVKMDSHEPCDSINVAYKLGWNACRAAMLAQPVSGGYKLPESWISRDERMPKDGDVVLVFEEGGIIFCAEVDNGEFYPDEFPLVPTRGKEITHWMPLPVAPEGGNG
ncbi:DUF551 domain-containing protein [Serratia marcescens]|uniref:DUF551 domain-containing protein n=1 Tax=Serratia marcescens TaxID=615 RepID=UPI003FCD93D2